MSHEFDSGLTAPVRTLLRAAVIAKLAPKARVNGGYLAAIVPFPRVIADRHDEDGINHAWAQLSGRAPSVLVALGDAKYESTSTTVHRYQAVHNLQVIVLCNSARGLVDRLTLDAAATRDDTVDPGIDVIEEHVRELLTGADLGLGSKVQDPQPTTLEHLETDESVTLWALNLTVSAAASVKPSRAELERLDLIVATLNGKPHPGTDDERPPQIHTFTQETPIP